MKTLLWLFLILFGGATMTMAQNEAVPLPLTTQNMHDMTLHILENGEIEIHTTGNDPYVFTEPLPPSFDPMRQHVLAFDYFCANGIDHMQVFVLPPLSEEHSIKAGGLAHSEGFSPYALDLKPILDLPGKSVRSLRLDFGGLAGKTLRIRGLRLRPQTAQEAQLAARKEAVKAAEAEREAHLREYLHHTYPCQVAHVAADSTQILVSGDAGAERNGLFLVEAPLYAEITELRQFPSIYPLHPDAQGHFHFALERRRKEGEPFYDRLLSRWAVARKAGTGYQLLSHARYADTVAARADLPEEKPRNKKGIGGISAHSPLSDVADLGLSSATVNIVLNGIFATTPATGRTAFAYGGQTWYTDDHALGELDKTMLEAAKHHLVISAIVLLGQGGDAPADSFSHRVAHPDADPSGIFVMPDVSSEGGLTAYAAALDFLAERYSRPDHRYGRIHHWILHNEVNAGWIWTNAGEKTPLLYTDLYQRSMRVAHLIARQYDPHAQAFISLEHHWNMRPTHIYAGRELLDLLLDFSKAEGDFDWAIAFHPYPQNLFDPRVWADNEVSFTFDTPKITFKNLEVLDAWVRQPRARYLGKTLRMVHLTEQGLNSPDYSEKSLQEQAAGMAYAWNKFKNLSSIAVFDYHNWIDNRGEGGLRIGLRRFPDDKDQPLGKKPIWYVYQALGTDREAEATAFAKAIIGINGWSEIRHHGEIQ